MHIEDERKTLEFKAKPAISIFLDDERADYKPGCSIIEISFPEPVTIEEVRFRNNYTAYIKIACKRVSAEKDVKNRDILPWQTSLRHFILMQEPECENNSQNLFSIPAKENLIPWTGIVNMRIVLKQPSFRWKKFGIEELTFFGDSTKDGRQSSASHSSSSSRRFESKTVVPEQDKMESLSPRNVYSWSVMDLMKDKETTRAAVGRFEEILAKNLELLEWDASDVEDA